MTNFAKGLNDLRLDWFLAKAGTAGDEANETVRSTRGTVTIPTSDTLTAATASIEVNGKVSQITFTPANMEGSDSTKMELIDEYGGTTYNSGTVAEAVLDLDRTGGTVSLWGTTKVVMTAEGTQSANRAIPYMILTER